MYVGRQHKEQQQYGHEQSEAEGVSEEEMLEEQMDTTSDGNTDRHEQMETHSAGNYSDIA